MEIVRVIEFHGGPFDGMERELTASKGQVFVFPVNQNVVAQTSGHAAMPAMPATSVAIYEVNGERCEYIGPGRVAQFGLTTWRG